MMTYTISNRYIREVKKLLPLYGDSEKKYLKNLKKHVDELCLNNNLTSIQQIYDEFGTPQDTVRGYVDTSNPKDLIPRIIKYNRVKKAVFITSGIILVISVMFISLLTFFYIVTRDTESTQITVVLTVEDEDKEIVQLQ